MKLVLGISFAAAAFFAALPASAYVYNVRSCTPSVDCPNTTHSGSSSTSPPTNADFQAFYSTQLGVDLSGHTFSWTSKTVNDYWFGMVHDFAAGIHASYLWDGTSVLCCTIDEPYEIVDANLVGLFVGNDDFGSLYSGQPVFPGFLAVAGGPFSLPAAEFTLTAEGTDFLAALGNPQIHFRSMGDAYDMLGEWDGGWLAFEADDGGGPLAHAPEPASALLLGTFAAGLFGWRRSRLRREAL